MNWWATWPAPPSSGIVVTDRAVLRLEHGGPLDAEIAPAVALSATAAGVAANPDSARRTRATAAFADVTDPAIAVDSPAIRRARRDDCSASRRRCPDRARDLDVLYLPGLDIAQHALLAAPDGGAPAPSAVAARVDALRSYYVSSRGARVARRRRRAKQIVMVVTQPGRVQSAAPGILGDHAAAAWPMRRARTRTARVVDVAPTVLLRARRAAQPRAAGPAAQRTVRRSRHERARASATSRPTAGRSRRRPRARDSRSIRR